MGKLKTLISQIDTVDKVLDMATEARMQRAQDMGLTEDVLHGTNRPDIFRFLDSKRGSSTGSESARKAHWFVDDPQTAGGYADLAADKEVTDLVNASQNAESYGEWDKAHELMVQAEQIEANPNRGQTIMPLKVGGNLKVVDMEGDHFMNAGDQINDILDQAKADGFDGVKFLNLADDPGNVDRTATHYAMFNTAKIRSPNADFDPAKKDSSNLLASASGAAVAAGASSYSEDSEAMFIGKLAKTFSQPAKKLAEQMEAEGFSRSDIWKATGEQFQSPMMRGADGEWRQEIDDAGSYLKVGKTDSNYKPTQQVYESPALMAAYPDTVGDLLTTRIGATSPQGAEGSYNPVTHQIDVYDEAVNPNSTMAHEGQHAIQAIEGWAPGNNTVMADEQAKNLITSHSNLARRYKQAKQMVDTRMRVENGMLEKVALRNTAFKLKEIDRLNGYLNTYYNGGKLTDKKRNILNSAGSITDNNVEWRIRNDETWPKRHRPQAERDEALARYIGKIVQNAEQDLDPRLVDVVRNEPVSDPLKKYERQIDATRKAIRNSEEYQEFKRIEQRYETSRDLVDKYAPEFKRKDGSERITRPYDLYRDTAGEIEARVTQERLGMDMVERIANAPWEGATMKKSPVPVLVDGNKVDMRKMAMSAAGGSAALAGANANARVNPDAAVSESLFEELESDPNEPTYWDGVKRRGRLLSGAAQVFGNALLGFPEEIAAELSDLRATTQYGPDRGDRANQAMRDMIPDVQFPMNAHAGEFVDALMTRVDSLPPLAKDAGGFIINLPENAGEYVSERYGRKAGETTESLLNLQPFF